MESARIEVKNDMPEWLVKYSTCIWEEGDPLPYIWPYIRNNKGYSYNDTIIVLSVKKYYMILHIVTH